MVCLALVALLGAVPSGPGGGGGDGAGLPSSADRYVMGLFSHDYAREFFTTGAGERVALPAPPQDRAALGQGGAQAGELRLERHRRPGGGARAERLRRPPPAGEPAHPGLGPGPLLRQAGPQRPAEGPGGLAPPGGPGGRPLRGRGRLLRDPQRAGVGRRFGGHAGLRVLQVRRPGGDGIPRHAQGGLRGDPCRRPGRRGHQRGHELRRQRGAGQRPLADGPDDRRRAPHAGLLRRLQPAPLLPARPVGLCLRAGAGPAGRQGHRHRRSASPRSAGRTAPTRSSGPTAWRSSAPPSACRGWGHWYPRDAGRSGYTRTWTTRPAPTTRGSTTGSSTTRATPRPAWSEFRGWCGIFDILNHLQPSLDLQ